MRTIQLGPTELHLSILRDKPYFSPTSNYYGLELQSKETERTQTIIVRDVSPFPKSYQYFQLTASTTTFLPNEGVAKTAPIGHYYVSVYPSSGSTVDDIDYSDLPLFKGLIKVEEWWFT